MDNCWNCWYCFIRSWTRIPLVAGTIISGAYFGDKMSPLSDSTNLAAAVTEVKLFDYIGHMLKTILLLPPILVVFIVIMKVPAVPRLLCGGILGGIFAVIFQKSTLADVILVSHYGFNSQSGFEAMDSLLSRGGLDSMMYAFLCMVI